MKRILDKPYMEGICPCCGSQIEYGHRNHMDNGGTIAWECPNCEASGEEGFDEVFDGMHYNVCDADGNECVYEAPADEKIWMNQSLYKAVVFPVPKLAGLTEAELLFRGQTRRKGEKVWMDGSPVDSNWVQGGVALGKGSFSIIYTYDPIDKYPVYTDTVCQYTGVDDMNGKRIFTKDILRVYVNLGCEEKLFNVLVSVTCGSFVCILPRVDGIIPLAGWNKEVVKLEVIGNLLDDPQLYEERGEDQ